MTIEERVEILEAAVEELLDQISLTHEGHGTPSLEDFHRLTVDRVQESKKRGGLSA